MNWEGSNPISGGMSDEELLKKYPDLRQEVESHPDPIDDREEVQEQHEVGRHPGCETCATMVTVSLDKIIDAHIGARTKRTTKHTPVYHHLVLMQVSDDPEETNWVIAFQDKDKEDAEQAMARLDDLYDGVSDLRFVTVVTQKIEEVVPDDGE